MKNSKLEKIKNVVKNYSDVFIYSGERVVSKEKYSEYIKILRNNNIFGAWVSPEKYNSEY